MAKHIGLFICGFFLLGILKGQDNDPLENVEFLQVDQLNMDQYFSDENLQDYYNRPIDDQLFKEKFLMPWIVDVDSMAREINLHPSFRRFFPTPESLNERGCHTGNYQPYSNSFLQSISHNTQMANFPNRKLWGITTESVDLRQIPTTAYCLQSIRNAGEGYPFDYLQQTSLWIGTPVLVLHQSLDLMWYFVMTPYGNGWLPANQVGEINNRQKKSWMNAGWLAILDDQTLVQTTEGIATLHTGTVLPYFSSNQQDTQYEVWIPHFRFGQNIKITSGYVPKFKAHPIPLPFEKQHVAKLLTNLLGGKYSWGGIDGGRDCSSTLKDFFTPFGIWLPRNSSMQRQVGQVISLEGTHEQKIRKIRQEGIPFQTIIYKRGHAMLFVGTNEEGFPLIFHNVWGLKPVLQGQALEEIAQHRVSNGIFGITPRADGVFSRFIIGRAVITPVSPERKFTNIKFDAFLDNIISMNILRP